MRLIDAPVSMGLNHANGFFGIEANGGGECAFCGVPTSWFSDNMYTCQRCQSIFVFRKALDKEKIDKGFPRVQIHNHADHIYYYSTCCPDTGFKCKVDPPVRSHLDYIQAHYGGHRYRGLFCRRYRVIQRWDLPRKEDCRCNGCAPGWLPTHGLASP
jgi:hypothetical protein